MHYPMVYTCVAHVSSCQQGESDNYYDPSNSLLPFVLAQRKGIPISLAILHAAIGRRAGLPIEFVGMPMHFMNKLGNSGSEEERFIDVFAGGRVLDRFAYGPLQFDNMHLRSLYSLVCGGSQACSQRLMQVPPGMFAKLTQTCF